MLGETVTGLPIDARDALIESIAAVDLVRSIKVHRGSAARVFQGFRATPEAVEIPIVRQRIADELEANPDLFEFLTDAWKIAAKDLRAHILDFTVPRALKAIPELCGRYGGANIFLALLLDDRKALQKAALARKEEILNCARDEEPPEEPAKPNVPQAADPRLREARDKLAQLQKENRRLSSDVRVAEKSSETALRAVEALRDELNSAAKSDSALQRKLERVEKELARSKDEVGELKRAVKDLRKALDAKPAGKSERRDAVDAPWQAAVARMIKSGSLEPAIEFLTALALSAPDDARPHEWLLKAYAIAKRPLEHRRELLWLGRDSLRRGDIAMAVGRLARAASGEAATPEAGKLLSSALSRIDLRNEKRMSEIRSVVRRLKQDAPRAFAALNASAEKLSPGLIEAIRQVHAAEGIDSPFRLAPEVVPDMAPREMIRAVDRNDAVVVAALRTAILKVRKARPEVIDRLKLLIFEHDSSCWTVITSETEPVIVDASNVANFDRHGAEHAKLANILAVRAELRRKRYWPVHIIADANLPYKIDSADELRRMEEAGEIELSPSRTDADEMIIHLARRLGCPVVTRDAMQDWDPDGVVHKMRFDIDRSSVEIIETEW